MTADLAPALYDVRITHTRRARMHRAFAHRSYLWLVDLDRLPRLPWWQRPFARFRPGDHLGDPDRPIRQNLDAWLATQGVDLAGGRVLMLASASVLGHVFNPITVYWCHRPGGAAECVVAEVHNTYGQRHCYLLRPDEAGRAMVDKDFYVSPFLDSGGHYLMRISQPGPRLSVRIALRQHGEISFTAGLQGERHAVTVGSFTRMLVRRPLATLRVSALIRWHGIALWLRRVPIVPRPPHAPQEGIQ